MKNIYISDKECNLKLIEIIYERNYNENKIIFSN